MNAHTGFGLQTRMTRDFGELIEAPSFVLRRWEPLDDHTTQDILELARALGTVFGGAGKRQKILRCFSDVCMALRASPNGLIAWPTGSAEMLGKPYGKDIALQVQEALRRSNLLILVQQSSKRDKLARVYWVDRTILKPTYKFKLHRHYPAVEVRSEKKRLANGAIVGGSTMGRRQFLGKIEPLEEQVFLINEAMQQAPLTGPDGRQYAGCRRIFNNSSLKNGGRLYGDWQTLKEEERLLLQIGEEKVCEIDVKACFLSIAFAKRGNGQDLPADPYSEVPFVRDCADQEQRKRRRESCKRLVVTYLCKEGEVTQFPKGEKRNAQGKLISFRDEYGLAESVGFYMSQLKEAYPFLEQQKLHGDDLMNIESNIIVNTILRLLDVGVVSYPVHDCLLVKKSDQDIAATMLADSMMETLNYIPALDVTYLDQKGNRKEELIQGITVSTNTPKLKRLPNYDYDLIEEWAW